MECTEKCCNEIFKVHKFLLIARSPTLGTLIEQSPDARNLNLIDIPPHVFRRVIEYFYDGILPMSDEKLKMNELRAVAIRLGLRELRDYANFEMVKDSGLEILNEDNLISIVEEEEEEEEEEEMEEGAAFHQKFIKILVKRLGEEEKDEEEQSAYNKFIESMGLRKSSDPTPAPAKKHNTTIDSENLDDTSESSSEQLKNGENSNLEMVLDFYQKEEKEDKKGDEELLTREEQFEIIDKFFDEICSLENNE